MTHINSTCISVTKASHTVTCTFKAVEKFNWTLCLEGEKENICDQP